MSDHKRKFRRDPMESQLNPARIRWKLLAETLKRKAPVESDCLPSGSVRKFGSFGVVKFRSSTEPWVTAEIRVGQQPYQVEIRFCDAQLQADKLIGFNNTGNVCVWPCEEILSLLSLRNLGSFEGLRVLELGGGMTSLAGLFVAKYSGCARVILTDGNMATVENLAAIASRSQLRGDFGVVPEVRRLRWGNADDIADLSGSVDLLLVSDCFFFDDSRHQLAETVDRLLSPGGILMGLAPSRHGTLECFAALMTSKGFDVEVSCHYDEEVDRLIDRVQRGPKAHFSPDLHFPILLRISRNQQVQMSQKVPFPSVSSSSSAGSDGKWVLKEIRTDDSMVVSNGKLEKILALTDVFPPAVKMWNVVDTATVDQMKETLGAFGSFHGFGYDRRKGEVWTTYDSWKSAEKFLAQQSSLKLGGKVVQSGLQPKYLERTQLRISSIPDVAVQHAVFLVMKGFGWIRDPPIKLFRPPGATCQYALLQYSTIEQLMAALRADLAPTGIKVLGTRVYLSLPMVDFANIYPKPKVSSTPPPDIKSAASSDPIEVKKAEAHVKPIPQAAPRTGVFVDMYGTCRTSVPTAAPAIHPAHGLPVRILVRNIRKLTSESILRIYLENLKMSGGGPVESIMWQPELNLATVKFQRHVDEQNLLTRLRNKKDFRLEGHHLFVSFLPPICPRRVFIRNVPADLHPEHLDNYIVARSKIDLEKLQFTRIGTGQAALATFSQGFGVLSKLQDQMNKRGLMGFQPKLEPVRLPDAVLITQLPARCHEDTLTLTITHILSTKQKGLGDAGEIRHVVINQNRMDAIVIFENYKTVDRLDSKFDLNGTPVGCQPFLDCIHGVEAEEE